MTRSLRDAVDDGYALGATLGGVVAAVLIGGDAVGSAAPHALAPLVRTSARAISRALGPADG